MPHAHAEVYKIDALKRLLLTLSFYFLDNQNPLFIWLKGIVCFIKLMFLTIANEVLTFNYTSYYFTQKLRHTRPFLVGNSSFCEFPELAAPRL